MQQMHISGPHLQMAVICSNVLVEQDGAVSVIRVIDRIELSGKEPEMPPYNLELLLFVFFKAGMCRGKHQIRIVPVSPSNSELPSAGIPLLFEGDDERGHPLKVDLRLTLLEEGLYWFDVYFEEVLVTRVPLRVVYSKQIVHK